MTLKRFLSCILGYLLKRDFHSRIQNEHDSLANRSSEGKLTWIEYNGQEVADSEFCIQFINKTFNIDLDKNFSDEEIGAGRAIQRMVDEHLYWYVRKATFYMCLYKTYFIYKIKESFRNVKLEYTGMQRIFK